MKTLKNLFGGKTKVMTMETVSSQSGEKSIFHSGALYQCPIKCEGDKTYDKPGNCPVCNMKRAPMNNGADSQSHHHDGCCC
ncbi:heavy metal-binding domain-containing protein [Mariniphaga sediminis]|uniref:heavy metal-binding domain-containing protein n=1 Tax=Mariniphaga sediminis TaxID=1628158 RepID=UPI0035620B78